MTKKLKGDDFYQGTRQFLLDKETLQITVKVENEEQVDELLRWMYGREKPMKSKLIELTWDKVSVPRDEAKLLENMREILSSE